MTTVSKIATFSLLLPLFACGGGGGTSADPLVGSWSGTFQIQKYVDGTASGTPTSGTASGTINGSRTAAFTLVYQTIPVLLRDNLNGAIDGTGQITSGQYLIWADSGPGAQSATTHNTSFSIAGGTLTGQFQVAPVSPDTHDSWRGTITVTRI